MHAIIITIIDDADAADDGSRPPIRVPIVSVQSNHIALSAVNAVNAEHAFARKWKCTSHTWIDSNAIARSRALESFTFCVLQSDREKIQEINYNKLENLFRWKLLLPQPLLLRRIHWTYSRLSKLREHISTTTTTATATTTPQSTERRAHALVRNTQKEKEEKKSGKIIHETRVYCARVQTGEYEIEINKWINRVQLHATRGERVLGRHYLFLHFLPRNFSIQPLPLLLTLLLLRRFSRTIYSRLLFTITMWNKTTIFFHTADEWTAKCAVLRAHSH